MLKLKLQYFGHLMRRVDSLEKSLMLRNWGQEEKEMTEDEMAGWYHWLTGYEFEWTLGVGNGQGGLVWCDSWGHKESDTTERLSWTEWLYNIQLKTSREVRFLPLSDAYVRSFLYLLYTLIKLYYTKALSDQASSLAPDWILLLGGQESWCLFVQQQPFTGTRLEFGLLSV